MTHFDSFFLSNQFNHRRLNYCESKFASRDKYREIKKREKYGSPQWGQSGLRTDCGLWTDCPHGPVTVYAQENDMKNNFLDGSDIFNLNFAHPCCWGSFKDFEVTLSDPNSSRISQLKYIIGRTVN